MAEMNKGAIKFCFKASLSATETLVLVQEAYGDEALNRSNVFRWYSRFQDGRELVEDDERGSRTDELKKVQKEELLASFQKLYNHTKTCIYANGAYFELKKCMSSSFVFV